MNLSEAIDRIEQNVKDPKTGLPEELFLFISRHTPLVNVDLLVKDENGLTLLAWRDDQYAGTGWHLPGGILRFKEKMETRLMKVAKEEIGAEVEFGPCPEAINQMIGTNDTRGHFISILFKGFILNNKVRNHPSLTARQVGYLKWHDRCPEDLIKVHEIYRNMIPSLGGGLKTHHPLAL
jgi:ADP-ribose pyrophosphatase YjhB (NUDIX family)